jgi:prolyl 4-hydroxylase
MVQPSQLLSVALGAGLAYVGPAVYSLAAPRLPGMLTKSPFFFQTQQNCPAEPQLEPYDYKCPADQGYRTEIVSLDPLLIYIHDFVSPREAGLIIRAGETLLQPSPVTGYGSDGPASQARTSWSAPLPDVVDNAAVACVLRRAESFLGTIQQPVRGDMGAAQLVHYDKGQKFDLHHDWFRQPRLSDADAAAGRRRLYNRVATFFVVLQANCTAGETYFPQAVVPGAPKTSPEAVPAGSTGPRLEGTSAASGGVPQQAQSGSTAHSDKLQSPPPIWREHEKGGMAFRPIAGNALFWVNLFANGTGDTRTLHAGLPVGKGTKTAMNIWPRAYFGPDA